MQYAMAVAMMGCEEESVEGCVQALSFIYSCTPPMVARAACELGVPDILQAAGEPLSALQIAERLQNPSQYASQLALHQTASRLERVMRCLCAHGVFKVHVGDDAAASASAARHVEDDTEGCQNHVEDVTEGCQNQNGHVEAERSPKYCLNAVSRWLVKCPERSLRGLLMFATCPAWMPPWEQLAEHIVQGGSEPFERAHGMHMWKYAHTYPHFSALFNNAMSSDESTSLQALLMHYHGFASVQTLVDVGGGVGIAASHIVSFYPSLKVICFDLPHNVAAAPNHPDVEFIAGDMFKSIPKGDAIFMKRVLHDWSDEDCINILNNCHKVLPQHGKVIIMDAVMEAIGEEKHPFSKRTTILDITMLMCTKGGKERTKEQWGVILKASNFGRYKIFKIPCAQCIIEAFPTLETTPYL